MTTQEKELMDVIATYDVSINREFNSLANMEFCEALAKAIIAKYPQIEKQPMKIESYEYDTPYKKVEYAIKLFQPFDSKLERMQWIERHYCEVFE